MKKSNVTKQNICKVTAMTLLLSLVMTLVPTASLQVRAEGAATANLSNRTYRLTDGVFKIIEVVPKHGEETLGIYMGEADGLSENENGEEGTTSSEKITADKDGYSGSSRVITDAEAQSIRSKFAIGMSNYFAPLDIKKPDELSDSKRASVLRGPMANAVTDKRKEVEEMRLTHQVEGQYYYEDAEVTVTWEDIREYLNARDKNQIPADILDYIDWTDELKDDRPITFTGSSALQSGKTLKATLRFEIIKADYSTKDEMSEDTVKAIGKAKDNGEQLYAYSFDEISSLSFDIGESDIVFENKNWFREKALNGNETVNLQYEVKEMAELTPRDVSDVDLIYFSAPKQSTKLSLFRAAAGKTIPTDGFTGNAKASEWLTIYKLYMRAISQYDRMALVIPNSIQKELSGEDDLRKLYQMLFYFNDPSNFRQFFKNGKFTTRYQYIDHLGTGQLYYGTDPTQRGQQGSGAGGDKSWGVSDDKLASFDNFQRYKGDTSVYVMRGLFGSAKEGKASDAYDNIYAYDPSDDMFGSSGKMWDILTNAILWQDENVGTYTVVLKADPKVTQVTDVSQNGRGASGDNHYIYYYNKFDVGDGDGADILTGKYITISFRIDGEDDEGKGSFWTDGDIVPFKVSGAGAVVVADRNGYHRIQIPYSQSMDGAEVKITLEADGFTMRNATITLRQQSLLTME